MARGSCIGGRLKPTPFGARPSACAAKLPPLAFGSLWSNNDGEYVVEARGYARHALALRASAPKKSPRATACISAIPSFADYAGSGIQKVRPASRNGTPLHHSQGTDPSRRMIFVMSEATIAAVMIHVGDVAEGLAWYEKAFPQATRNPLTDIHCASLTLGSVHIELVPSDSKVASGPAGSVVYWQTQDFQATLWHLQGLGARLYRGPMAIEEGQSMCQVQDPWGNCIGLRG